MSITQHLALLRAARCARRRKVLRKNRLNDPIAGQNKRAFCAKPLQNCPFVYVLPYTQSV